MILLSIVAVLVLAGAGGLLMLPEKKMPFSEKTIQQEESLQKTQGGIQLSETHVIKDVTSPIEPTLSPVQSIQPQSSKIPPELKPKLTPPASPEKMTTKWVNNITSFFENGLGPICSRDTCQQFCRDNPFTCEAYCVSRPQNKYCQQHFSFVYDIDSSIGHPLMRFAEFRNYNYTFTDGKLDQKEPKIEHIGVEIDFYNKQTNKAGDFVFDTFTYPRSSELYRTKIFHDFGESALKPDGIVQQAPELTYIVPLGTKVRATTDGIITHITQQPEGDTEFVITKPESPLWIFGYDHVINPTIKKGDRVVVGQILGEASNYDQWLRGDGYGLFEVSVVYTNTGYTGHCPFMYLDESVKQDYLNKIKALYASWEEYTGNSLLYDEDNYFMPGCVKRTLE